MSASKNFKIFSYCLTFKFGSIFDEKGDFLEKLFFTLPLTSPDSQSDRLENSILSREIVGAIKMQISNISKVVV